MDSVDKKPCCCCCQKPSVVGSVAPGVGDVPQVTARLTLADRLGAWKMRWGVGRMTYRVEPGLYALGNPRAESPVLVSANYKLSFDRLRQELHGLDVWILVLDTKGVNVWCAAGKGTFGTDELVGRVKSCQLSKIVNHRTLIVPQLGAPGVAAHEVRKASGFRVVYGPVRAADIPAFLAADMRAAPEMRRVRFPFGDRMAVAPIDMLHALKYVVALIAIVLLLAGFAADGYSIDRVVSLGIPSAVCVLLTFLAGTVLTLALLPWLPGRALAVKGLWIGLAMFATAALSSWGAGGLYGGWMHGPLTLLAWALMLPAMSSCLATMYTGSTTYTSLSGVLREVRWALPLQAVAFTLGLLLWIVARFL